MFRPLLVLSLLANAALAAVFVSKISTRPAAPGTPPAAAAHVSAAGPAASSVLAPAPDTLEPDARRSAAAGVLKWENLPADDFPALVARLRAAGFPPKAIRAVLSALLGRQYVARQAELTAADDAKPFWRVTPFSRDPKTAAELSQLGRQHAATLRELLGPEADDTTEEAALWQRQRFGDLPPDKLRRVNEIVSDYNDLLNQARRQRVLLAEDRERIAFLEKERRADLAAVLTPAELEELDLRSSNLSSELRWQTAGFEPTREEFSAIYRATLAAKEKLGEVDNGSITIGSMPSERQKLVMEQLKTMLSPERLAEFEVSTDPQYRQTALLVQRLQLPSAVTKDVAAIQSDATARSRALREDQKLAPDERNAQLAALAQETTTKLTAKLGGARGFEAYQQTAGQWLQSLASQRP